MNKITQYTLFTMRELFQNSNMAAVLPQVEKSSPLQNVYSYRVTEQRVRNYLEGVLRTVARDDDGLVVRGKHNSVLKQIEGLKPQIEALFNVMPRVVKGIRSNIKLYLPYATISQIAGLKGVEKKQALLKQILDNLSFNPDLVGDFRVPNKKQEAWKKKVGYK